MEDAAQRFITAFNDLEAHFRAALGAGEHEQFAAMARDYVARRHLPRSHAEALAVFARLRNAISHGTYREGRPIADPRPDLVERIEWFRSLYLQPPTALGVLGQMEVRSVTTDEPVSAALEYVRLFDYSQLPVYDSGGYAGILTTNAIARWLAAQLVRTGGLAKAEPVGHVLAFAEPGERARHVPRTTTAADAIHQLSKGGPEGKPLTALLITQSGRKTETPLAVVVDDDLPR